MTTHRPHPITGPWPYAPAKPRMDGLSRGLVDREPTEDSLIYDDPEDALLFDGCDRCEEHAANPFRAVDADRLVALWREMVAVERHPDYRDHYRTKTEARAGHHLYRIAVFVERTHPSIDPWRWPWCVRGVALPLDGTVTLHEGTLS